ncbi:MAG: Uma2 family endonuclease [Tetrasphaera sp.]
MTTLPRSRPLTRDDLNAMPDDGHRYELLDGSLIVTPAPSRAHQRVLARLHLVLASAIPRNLEMLFAPFDVVLAADTVLQPDLLIARRADFTPRDLPVAPLLAVEILSPSTRRIDLHTKRARYEAAGCPSYWVVDPDDPAIIAWELRDGQYAEVARARDTESFRVTAPFPVQFRPTDLTT